MSQPVISQTRILRQFAVDNGIDIHSRGRIGADHPVHAAYAASLVPAKKARKASVRKLSAVV